MNIRAALLDFDGTLFDGDSLDVLCGLAGKQEQSAAINKKFTDSDLGPIESLTARINLLNGVTVAAVEAKLRENLFLREGTDELMEFFRKKGIVTILNSGQILPALRVYQKRLGIDHVVGTDPDVQKGIIRGIPPECPIDVDFKWNGCIVILNEREILPTQVVALGDSIADKLVFDRVGLSIAVSPKGGIEDHADHAIGEDLRAAIPIIGQAMET